LDQIHSLVTASELEALSELVAETSSPDIADMLYRLPPVDAAVVYRLLHKDKAIDVCERLDSATQADLVTELAETEVVRVFEALDPADIVGLLDELPAKRTKRLLRTLSPRQRTATAPILGYPHGSIGRRMTPEYVSARAEEDRKSTRLNSSHVSISYAVFCLKKKTRSMTSTLKRRQ